MKKWIVTILIVSSSLLVTGCTFPWIEAKNLTNQGVQEYSINNFDQAYELLTQAVQSRKRNPQAWYYLGMTQFQKKEYQKAKDSYSNADKYGFDTGLLANGYGDIAMAQGEYLAARDYFLQAVQTNNESADNHADLALAYYYGGDFSKAHEHFDKAIILDQGHFKALLNKGVLLADSGELDRSLKYFDAAIQVEPDNVAVIYNKATVLSDISYSMKVEQASGFAIYAYSALELLDKVLEKEPTYINAYIFKGITYYDIQDFEMANEMFDMALGLDPNAKDALFYKGRVLIAQENNKEAKIIFEKLLLIDPSNLQAQQELENL